MNRYWKEIFCFKCFINRFICN